MGSFFFLCLKFPYTLENQYPMRRKLSEADGQRKRFRATFSRFGKKTNFKGYSEETVLLVSVRDCETGLIVTSHLWFGYSAAFQRLHLTPGVHVQFEARVKAYRKGYVNKAAGINHRQQDFKLSHPTKVQILPMPE